MSRGIKNTKEILLKIIKKTRSGCWEWQGLRDKDGYGMTRWNGKTVRLHRLFYSDFSGIIEKGKEVCHTCDNPPCCNPRHLFLGTTQENKDDSVRKGRVAHGERIGLAKLTEVQVQEIRDRKSSGGFFWGGRVLAKKFGVTEGTIRKACRGATWKRSKQQ